ncbi:MAG: hypothetical protein AB7Q37_08410 [Pyrinomonadaceae bacterium]
MAVLRIQIPIEIHHLEKHTSLSITDVCIRDDRISVKLTELA